MVSGLPIEEEEKPLLPPEEEDLDPIIEKSFTLEGLAGPTTVKGKQSEIGDLSVEDAKGGLSDLAKERIAAGDILKSASMSESEGRRLGLQEQIKSGKKVGTIDPDVPDTIQQGEFESLTDRFLMNLSTNDELFEKVQTIQSTLGLDDKDILTLRNDSSPGGVAILIRPKGADYFVEIDNPTITTWSDLADVAPEILNGILTAYGSIWGTGKAFGATAVNNAYVRSFGMGLAEFVRFQVESGIRRVTGGEETSFPDALRQGRNRGLFEGIANIPGEMLSVGGRAYSGQSLHRPESLRELAEAMDSINERLFNNTLTGAEEAIINKGVSITAGDTVPAIARLSVFAGKISSSARAQSLDRLAGLRFLVDKYQDYIRKGGKKLGSKEIDKWLTGAENQMKEVIRAPIRGDARFGIDRVVQGIDSYRKVKFEQIDGLVKKAGKTAEDLGITYNVTKHVPRIRRLLTGKTTNQNLSTAGLNEEELAARTLQGEIDTGLPDARFGTGARPPGPEDILARRDPRVSKFGNEFPGDFEQVPIVGTELDPNLRGMMEQFVNQPTLQGPSVSRLGTPLSPGKRAPESVQFRGSSADDLGPDVAFGGGPRGGVDTSAFEQLFIMRMKAANYLDGSGSIDELAALEFIDVLDSTLLDVSTAFGPGAKGGKLFNDYRREAIRALDETSTFNDLMDGINVREIVRASAGRPEELGRRLINPRTPDRVRSLKEVLKENPNDFKRAIDGYENTLIEEPSTIAGKLDQWDSKTIREFITEERELELRAFGRDWDEFTKMKDVLTTSENFGAEAIEVLFNKNPAAAAKLIEGVGGIDSAGGRMLRAGILQHMMFRASSFEMGYHVLNPRSMEKQYRAMLESGNLDIFFAKEDQGLLKLISEIGSYLPKGAGAGESIAAQELSNAATNVLRPIRSGSAQLNIARIQYTAWLFTNPRAAKRFRKGAKRPTLEPGTRRDVGYVRPFIAASTSVLGDVQKTDEAFRKEQTANTSRGRKGALKDAFNSGLDFVLGPEDTPPDLP